MKHRDRASEGDRAYQLAREEEVMDDYEKRQREVGEILRGRRPGVPPILWVIVGIWAGLLGVVAWAIARAWS